MADRLDNYIAISSENTHNLIHSTLNTWAICEF